MMSFWTLDRLTDALAGQLHGAQPRSAIPLGSVATDSRALVPGDVFLALRGARFDAHDFLDQALQRGASALVVADPRRIPHAGVPVVVVADTTTALGALGRYRRRAWGRPVVAVAGSNGKTGTKELIAASLGARYMVHATRGNLNNHVGVPLTLLELPDAADIAVVEIGTNHPGEVATLRELVEPDIALVTSIGEEHLEGLGDLAGVLREECAVYEGASLGIAPSSQPAVGDAARRLATTVVEAGLEYGDLHPDTWALDGAGDGRGWFTVGPVRVDVPLLGAHNLRNALLALAVARACGVSDEDAARGIGGLSPLPMRSALERIGTLRVLNDAYNANPASAREALATFDALPGTSRRVVVLGSMLELGVHSAALHGEIARRALASTADVVAGVGEFARAFHAAAPDDARTVTAADVEDLWPLLRERLTPDALILLKGSRGMRLERLIPKLREYAGLEATSATVPH